jgi:hypothetical protein
VALHQKLKGTSYTPQEVRLIILGAYNARRTDAALTAADMPYEAGATHRSTEIGSIASTSQRRRTITASSGPRAPFVRRIPFSEYKNRKREQGILPKIVPLPEITGESIGPVFGYATSVLIQTPNMTTGPLSGMSSSM